MEGKGGSVPDEGDIKGSLGILEEKKSKLADKLEDRKSKLGNCTNLFAANFNAARGMAAKGWESSSQSQEDADAVKQERVKKPVVEKNLTKKVRRNLFGKQHSFQNIKVQQEMQQKKRELGELLRRKENLKEESKEEASSKALKNIKDARPSTQESKSGDESSAIVFPASPSKSVRQSQVSTWVTMTTTSAQQALPKLTHSKAPRSRSPRRREKSSSGKHQDDSKWSVYQRVKAGRRPGNQQGGKEGRRSRFSSRENRKQEKKSFDFFNNKCSFFDSIETKDKDEGPLDFLFADGHNDEEPRVTLHLHIILQFFLVSKLNFFNLAFRNIKCRR